MSRLFIGHITIVTHRSNILLLEIPRLFRFPEVSWKWSFFPPINCMFTPGQTIRRPNWETGQALGFGFRNAHKHRGVKKLRGFPESEKFWPGILVLEVRTVLVVSPLYFGAEQTFRGSIHYGERKHIMFALASEKRVETGERGKRRLLHR